MMHQNQNKKFYGFVLSLDTFSSLKTIFSIYFKFLAHLGPLRGNKVFIFKKNMYPTLQSYLWTQMSFRMFIFN